MTREELVALVGEDNVRVVESINCEMTNKVGFNGKCTGDETIEWRASFDCLDLAGGPVGIEVFYYTTQEDEDTAAASEDWSAVTFDPHHYGIY